MRQRQRVVDLAVEALGGIVHQKRIAVLGVTFKPESDDVRDSPALDVAVQLKGLGAEVIATDPEGIENARRRHPQLDYTSSTREALRGRRPRGARHRVARVPQPRPRRDRRSSWPTSASSTVATCSTPPRGVPPAGRTGGSGGRRRVALGDGQPSSVAASCRLARARRGSTPHAARRRSARGHRSPRPRCSRPRHEGRPFDRAGTCPCAVSAAMLNPRASSPAVTTLSTGCHRSAASATSSAERQEEHRVGDRLDERIAHGGADSDAAEPAEQRVEADQAAIAVDVHRPEQHDRQPRRDRPSRPRPATRACDARGSSAQATGRA